MASIRYAHMDVFADKPLRGNGLAVCFPDTPLAAAQMREIAREFKQFETIFLTEWTGDSVCARIFTVEEELPFAGHPVLGGVAALHLEEARETLPVAVRLSNRIVPVVSHRRPHGFTVTMRQGPASFGPEISGADRDALARAHGLAPSDLEETLPIQVVGTGLPYALIPVARGLDRARVAVSDLGARLAAYGAAYAYLFDSATLEARAWDNLGLAEDSATGSAAGPLAAYLVRHGRAVLGEKLCVAQGRHAHRPGLLTAWVAEKEVFVSGDAVVFAQGRFRLA